MQNCRSGAALPEARTDGGELRARGARRLLAKCDRDPSHGEQPGLEHDEQRERRLGIFARYVADAFPSSYLQYSTDVAVMMLMSGARDRGALVAGSLAARALGTVCDLVIA